MSTLERPPWSRRTFQFSHPEWMLADFIERLRGTADRLAALLADVPAARVHAPVEGSWSIAQHAGHLADVEELWKQRVEDLRAGRTILTPARGPYFTELAARHVGRPILDILAEFAHRRNWYVDALAGADCVFRLMSITRFGSCRSPISAHVDHPFR